jgi:hypothetical protein
MTHMDGWALKYHKAVLEVHPPKKLALAAAARHAIAARLHDGRSVEEKERKLIHEALQALQTLEAECLGWPPDTT